MSELSYLEKLLDGVEVEWKSLGDVVNFQRGRRLVKSQLETRGKYAVYQNSMTPLGYYHEYNVAAQSSFIICAGAAGEIGYSENEFWAADDVHFAITPEYINDRFLFHFLLTQKNKISGQVRRASIPRLSKSVIEKLEFPIPCPDNPEKSLAIQSEIVRILDKFTALTAELTAELNMRKKQYNYYRDQLLSFDEGEVEWKALEEVSTFANGKGHEKDISEDGKYIVVNSKFISTNGEVAKLSNKQLCPLFKDDILLVMSDLPNGKALSKTFIVDEDHKYTLNQRIGGITVKNSNELLPKFLHYFLNRTPQLLKHDNGVDQTNLRKGQILEVKIPIISLIKQVQIVETLDKFDTYTKSISEGLPREIELRHKQYEYYRDLLFSFPRPETASN
ncbi:restriction endonuclease [Escherichia coli]|uniref:restriction endonuclease subunit S n=1 Tax=Enterobacteriaceae TaxID=543 RepID=UPI0006DB60A8|nr:MULTISPECIES: restriction endonuclease subunit S [Enterobacteriaceae]MBS6212328.1 restriction endonuclease subunit S [Proteus hauseri]EFL3029441.1 restriction endonuclease subunit S [Escherichia coli]EFL3071661.1 restriction endonuclease subunit S [Escherichia coli]EGD1665428.1 restriction endonuclease subunit S [Escherichia coli]EGI6840186.1 restriction endonuclease subunit S [Escherichia coli]